MTIEVKGKGDCLCPHGFVNTLGYPFLFLILSFLQNIMQPPKAYTLPLLVIISLLLFIISYLHIYACYSLVCFEFYIEMFTHYFLLDFFVLILCFQLSFMMLNIVGVHSFHYYLVSHSMNIMLFIHSFLKEIILVPVLATTNKSSLNIFVHGFGWIHKKEKRIQ